MAKHDDKVNQQYPRLQPSMYVLWRFVVLAGLLAILVVNILHEIFTYGLLASLKWPIYLTHWMLLLAVIQQFFQLFKLMCSWDEIRKISDWNHIDLSKIRSPLVRISRYTILILSMMVTLLFWSLVYNPVGHDSLYVLRQMVPHLLPSFLYMVDDYLCHEKHPWSDCLLVLVIGALYIGFSWIYFYCGGTNELGLHYIYKVLNWGINPIYTLFFNLDTAFLGMIASIFLLAAIEWALDSIGWYWNSIYLGKYNKVPVSTEACKLNGMMPVTRTFRDEEPSSSSENSMEI